MRTAGGSKNILPLIETAVAVFFLALSCAAALQMFLIARSNGQLARDITDASIRAQSIVERIKSSDSRPELDKALSGMFGESRGAGTRGGTLYSAGYDAEWNETLSDAEYTITIELVREEKGSGELYSIYVTAQKAKPYPLLKGEDRQKLADFQNAKYISYSLDS